MKTSIKKVLSAIIDRIVANPITTILGVILIGVGTFVYITQNHEAGMLMVGAGSALIMSVDK